MLSCLVVTFVENIFVGWYVSLQQEDVLSPMLCSFVLEYFTRKIQAN